MYVNKLVYIYIYVCVCVTVLRDAGWIWWAH